MRTYEIRPADDRVHWMCSRQEREGRRGERLSLPPVTILVAKDLADALNVHEAEKVDYKVQ